MSVVILTHNEALNIEPCLDSLREFSDVHVVDSGSTDGTVEIVTSRGVSLLHHPFRSFGDQRNWAIDNIVARHDWQLHLDADERMTPALAREIHSELRSQPDHGGYFLASKLMLGETWLKHAGDYPTYQVRLFHKERLRFVDHGHGQREQTERSIGTLSEPYLHYAFSKGLDHWFAKHATYARLEAEQAAADRATLGQSFRGLLDGDRIARRRALKSLTWHMPFRPSMRLLYHLLIKRAFLDGRAGVTFSYMMAAYETMALVNRRLIQPSTRRDTPDAR